MFCRRRDCKWVACLLWIFTAALGLLLTIQTPFVLLFCLDRELRIPANWVEKALNYKLDGDFTISLESVTLDKSGTIRIRDAVLRNHMHRDVARADLLKADLFLPAVIFGIFLPEKLEARDVEILDFQGPLGLDEPLITAESLRIAKDEFFWRIEDGRVLLGDLPISLSGELRKPSGKVSDDLPDPTQSLNRFLDQIPTIRDQIARFSDPFLQIKLLPGEANRTGIRVLLTANRAELPFEVRLEEDVRISGNVFFSSAGISPRRLRATAREMTVGDEIEIESPKLQVDPSQQISFPAGLVGTKVRLTFRNMVTPEATLTEGTLAASVERNLTVPMSGQVSLWEHPFSLEGRIYPLRQMVELQTEGVLSIADALNHRAVPPEARDLTLHFENDILLRAQTEIQLSDPFPKVIRFQAESGSANLQGFEALHARAQGEFFPPAMTVSIKDLDIQTDEYHLNARYDHDFRSNFFRFWIHGGFIPTDISGWMREWWDEIWPDFIIRDIPYVDLYVEGDWDHRDEREMFGGIRFRNLSLHGMRIDRGYAKIRSLPYFFQIYEMKVFRPEGEAMGGLANLLDWETREMFATVYDFTSTLDFDQVAPLFGEKIEEIVSKFTLTQPPLVVVKGALFPNIPGKTSPIDNLKIKAVAEAPLTYSGIQLERLSFEGIYEHDTLHIDPINFGLGGGTGEGWLIQRQKTETGPPSSLSFKLTNGDPASVVEAIPVLKANVDDRFVLEEKADPEIHKVDFSVECSGNFDDPESLLGEGSIDLLTPNLANVRLFGIFSRISEELPLPITLGSFQFERVSATFLLNRGLVEIPNMTLHSSSSRLLGSGSYRMDDQTIDFNARMQLLGEVKFPILAQLGILLSPVGRVFEFRIWGELEDLDWRLYLDPRSW